MVYVTQNAVFNVEKLDWLNGYYIRQLEVKELTEKYNIAIITLNYDLVSESIFKKMKK